MVSASLRNPYIVLVACLIVIVLGLFSMTKLPMDILPTFRIPAVMVVTTYTGMPAEMMEMDITNRLERWLSQASGLDHMESRSMIGVSILNCFFEPGFDPNNALAQISTLVMSDLHYLPPGTQPPIVMGYDPTAALPVGLLTIFTPNLDEAKLWDESNYIVRNQLNAVPGAVAPVVFGGKLREIMVFLNRLALSGYGMSPLDVVAALVRGNAMVPTGDAKIGKYDYSITSNGMVPNLAAFDQIPIKISGGAPVFIKDVGHTEDASAVQTNVVQVNGVKQTYIPLFRRIGASTLKVVDNIKAVIPEVLQSLPDNSVIKLVFDQSPKIREAIVDVMQELVIGVLLAALIIYLFLGSLAPTFVAALVIPLSIIGGMVALYYAGQSLNLMTLGGLALTTGPLIDKAVVALENIERHLELGATPLEAAERGVSEVSGPVLMATLAMIVVFFPVTFFEGLGKFLFTPMAVSVWVTQIISYFLVMAAVPLLAVRLFKGKADHHHQQHAVVRRFNQGFDDLKARYTKLLDYSLKFPALIVTLCVGALLGSLLLVFALGTEFFPVTDHGQFFVRVRGPVGIRIELMSDKIVDISKSIHDLLPKDSVDIILANTGVLPSWAAAYSANSASHDSVLEVGLSEKSSISGDDAISILRDRFRSLYPDVGFSFSQIDSVASALNYGALSALDLRVFSPNLEKGQGIARDLLAEVNEVRGITDAFIEQQLDYPALHIEVNRTKAAYMGLGADAVIKNIITALNSSVLFSPNFWDDPVSGNNYFIGAMYPEQQITSTETIKNIPLLSSAGVMKNLSRNPSEPDLTGTGAETLLRNIATVSTAKLPVEITHYNIKRVFDIVANIKNRDIGSVANDIDKIVAKYKFPKGYKTQWVGQVDAMRASFGSMGVGMVLSLVLVFLLMVAQLKSFIDPLLIMATVPMGFIGVIWMLFLTNTTINIQSMMGMIMLIGIIVSNTVILTDFANQRIAEGVLPFQAIREAGVTRMRPILMTAVSAVMAFLPSAFSGANAPLARAVIGGLISSTFLSLIFLPALYVLSRRNSN